VVQFHLWAPVILILHFAYNTNIHGPLVQQQNVAFTRRMSAVQSRQGLPIGDSVTVGRHAALAMRREGGGTLSLHQFWLHGPVAKMPVCLTGDRGSIPLGVAIPRYRLIG
jgi:hypothetical protein